MTDWQGCSSYVSNIAKRRLNSRFFLMTFSKFSRQTFIGLSMKSYFYCIHNVLNLKSNFTFIFCHMSDKTKYKDIYLVLVLTFIIVNYKCRQTFKTAAVFSGFIWERVREQKLSESCYKTEFDYRFHDHVCNKKTAVPYYRF